MNYKDYSFVSTSIAYFSYELHLHLFDPIIYDMVSERYRCAYSDHEDNEEDFVGEEEDSVGDEDLEASASESSCSSTSQDCFIFGTFGDSVSASGPTPWNASFQPAVDGFTIKIGVIPCFLVDSRCCSDHNSVFDASEENKNSHNLDSLFHASAESVKLNNRKSEFTVSEVAIKNSMSLVTDFVLSGSGPVYGVSFFFVGKQEQALITVNNKLQYFQLHDESIVNFDLSGNCCGSLPSFLSSSFSIPFFVYTSFVINRLWWIPWDRGKKQFSDGTLSCAHHPLSCDNVAVQDILSTFFSYSITIKKVWLDNREHEHNRAFGKGRFGKRAFPISCFGKSVFRLSCFRKARYATVLLERLLNLQKLGLMFSAMKPGRKCAEVCD